ncbi:ATP-binding protein [Helicovermis profundi]|uniref:ATP-binding protein n=1 Tax=Helicovermis profundi TaxID=3065157 RepID=A0AAU9ERK8_9FIRM|nr:ATP-binding protein [Clostridia bacterium S502]
MKIAVLSGKGGTGKTFVSTNLAYVSKESTYLDCDVEEPNGRIFFKPIIDEVKEVKVKVPSYNQEQCDGCRKCVDICHFNALAFAKNKVVIFEELCHSCGGCSLVCPTGAMTEKDKIIGKIEYGNSENVRVGTGLLNIGEITGVPVINEIVEANYNTNDIIIDSPPGSSCSVMEAIKDVDYCVFVVEPTVFGIHNFKLVYELVKIFNKNSGIVINKHNDSNRLVEEFAKENNVTILKKIPFNKKIGLINSKGILIAKENKEYYKLFKDILDQIKEGEK